MDSKRHINYAEFYITNVCNLNCTHCNRYNNYRFKGWQAWDDYKDIYQRWAEYIDIEHLAILGGEPLLNPDIIKWCEGLYLAFRPNGGAGIDIVTNGYHLNRVKGLKEFVRSGRAFITVSLHNPNEKDFIFDEIQKFLESEINLQVIEPGKQWYIEDGYVKIFVNANWDFTTSSIIVNAHNRLTLHNNDPEIAHSVCAFAQCKDYHFIKGKFYKCGPVALLPEFDQQFHLDISDDDRILLNSYQPLTVEDFEKKSSSFFTDLDNPIPQCKFCPSKMEWQPLFALPKASPSFR